MCCHLPLNPKLGGAKVYIEAAETYRLHGHEVRLVGIDEMIQVNQPVMDESWRLENYPTILKRYIEEQDGIFDVVEFEAPYLSEKPKLKFKTLLVARSVLLDLHLHKIKIPRFGGIRSSIGFLLKGPQRRRALQNKIHQSIKSMQNAELINVPNPSDAQILLENHFPKEKIIIQPYGIFKKRWESLSREENEHKKNIVAFVGTFDNRKGAVEFPKIMKILKSKIPDIQFRLLGVLAMFPTKEAIEKYLGPELTKITEIVPSFSPDELKLYLKDCKVGLFPSYLESFGFGVLEMMASGLPVVGYDSPGINMLIDSELLVPQGNGKMCAEKLTKLLTDEKYLTAHRKKAQSRAEEFIYENQKNNSLDTYMKLVSEL